jgi:hypothetical protein
MLERSRQRAARAGPPVGLVAFAVLVASIVGVLTALSPSAAVAVAVGAIVVPAAMLRPKLVIYVLVATVFTEFLAVGGLTVGRLVAPIAVIAVIAESVHAPVHLRGGGRVLAFVLGYAFVALASLLWTESSTGTLGQLGSLAIALVYMGAFAVLVRTPLDLRRLFGVMAVCSAVLGAFWIASYLLQVGRGATGAGDPNFFAGDQAVALAAVVALAAYAKTPGRRVLLFLLVAVIAASVVASLSRSGILALLTAGLLMLILPSSMLFRTRSRKVMFFAAAALGLAIILPLAGSALGHRFETGVAHAGGNRRDLWLAAATAYKQHPVLGIGYGAFQPNMWEWMKQTHGVDLTGFSPKLKQTGQPVHNAYLQSLTELGPVGLIMFVGLILATGRSFYRTARLTSDRFLRSSCVALLIGLFAFCIAAALLPVATSRTLWMFVGLGLALPGIIAPARVRWVRVRPHHRHVSGLSQGQAAQPAMLP